MIVLREGSVDGSAVSLDVMTPDAAAILGPPLAAIEPWARYPFTATALTAYLADHEPHAPRFQICTEQMIVGAVGIRQNWLRGPYLQFLGLLPGHQGDGIGSLVLSWLEREAVEKKSSNIWVAASDFNTSALRFYERHGFRRVARLDGLVQEGYDEIMLRKRLPAT